MDILEFRWSTTYGITCIIWPLRRNIYWSMGSYHIHCKAVFNVSTLIHVWIVFILCFIFSFLFRLLLISHVTRIEHSFVCLEAMKSDGKELKLRMFFVLFYFCFCFLSVIKIKFKDLQTCKRFSSISVNTYKWEVFTVYSTYRNISREMFLNLKKKIFFREFI